MKTKSIRMLTVKEVANILRVHPNTVRQWSEEGLLQSCRLGHRGDRRFRQEDIDTFLAAWDRGRSRRNRVLIVDDDDEVRSIIQEVAVKNGYRVTSVKSGEEAVEVLKEYKFHLIFLDLVLPGISGLEVLKLVKAQKNEPVVAIITGYGETPIATEAMSLGPTFFIHKPIEMKQIINIMNIATKLKK